MEQQVQQYIFRKSSSCKTTALNPNPLPSPRKILLSFSNPLYLYYTDVSQLEPMQYALSVDFTQRAVPKLSPMCNKYQAS